MEELHQSFSAPMGKTTVTMTVIVSLILLGAGLLQLTLGLKRTGTPKTLLVTAGSIILAGIAGSLYFKIRGYDVTASHVVVRFGFSGKKIPISDISDVRVKPNALKGASRDAANGGMWSFLGLFSSQEMGNIRAYVSDLEKTVVLSLPQHKVVVSPDRPDVFAEAVRSVKGGQG